MRNKVDDGYLLKIFGDEEEDIENTLNSKKYCFDYEVKRIK